MLFQKIYSQGLWLRDAQYTYRVLVLCRKHTKQRELWHTLTYPRTIKKEAWKRVDMFMAVTPLSGCHRRTPQSLIGLLSVCMLSCVRTCALSYDSGGVCFCTSVCILWACACMYVSICTCVCEVVHFCMSACVSVHVCVYGDGLRETVNKHATISRHPIALQSHFLFFSLQQSTFSVCCPLLLVISEEF